ncbi:MAG: class I SAM-dependent methyltransferase [bacterium]
MAECGGYDDSSLIAEAYDHVDPYQNRPDVDFYADEARKSGGPVLEIGCGTGRILIPTARQGIEIVGLDFSVHMQRACREKLAEEPAAVRERVQLVKGDMRDFDLKRQFALVTMPFRPFQHLISTNDQIACLQCVHRHLKPGGRLIFDLFFPNMEYLSGDNLGQEQGDEPEVEFPDGRKFLRRFRITRRDVHHQVQDVEIIYYITYPDGRKETVTHGFPMRYLWRFEVEHLLARCDLKLIDVYADFERTPFGTHKVGEMVVVAERG